MRRVRQDNRPTDRSYYRDLSCRVGCRVCTDLFPTDPDNGLFVVSCRLVGFARIWPARVHELGLRESCGIAVGDACELVLMSY